MFLQLLGTQSRSNTNFSTHNCQITNKLYQRTGSGDGDHLQVSAHVMIESVDHIKTVIALGAEEYFVNSINYTLLHGMVHTIYSVCYFHAIYYC